MKVIWKYPIQINDIQTLTLPIGAEILCFQSQHNSQFIWCLVDMNCTQYKDRNFEIHGTGNPFDIGLERKYIGTIQKDEYVLHLFERI
jgi:hypothetical protein